MMRYYEDLSLPKTDTLNAELGKKKALSCLMKELDVGIVDPISYSEDEVYCTLNATKGSR